MLICTFRGYFNLYEHNKKISQLGDFYDNKEKLEPGEGRGLLYPFQ